MPQRSEEEVRQMFDARFKRLGGGLSVHSEWQRGIDSLAKGLTAILKLPDSIYCDVVVNDAVNAFVTKHQDTYFIGITDGVVTGVFRAIGAVLEKLGRGKGVRYPFLFRKDAVGFGYGSRAASGCGRNDLPRMEPG